MMKSTALRPYLDDLEARIDLEQEATLLDAWEAFSEGRCESPVFSPFRKRPKAPGLPWPKVKVNDTLDDFDLMALQQFSEVSETIAGTGGNLLNVRCNYGTSILPGLFGVDLFIMPGETDTLPTSRPFNDLDAIRRIIDNGAPDLSRGWGARVLEMGERFVEISRSYPKIGQSVFIYHPDLQGPLDIAEVVWGSSLFYALYDYPELVHQLLEVITETYMRFMRAWTAIVPFRPQGSSHWGFYIKGNLMLRDDSAMNLSPAMYAEFARPYDQRLLDEFGGGAIHFCGKGDHFIAQMAEMRGLTAINLGQPELNDLETIFHHTVDRGINLLGFSQELADRILRGGRSLHGRVHASPG